MSRRAAYFSLCFFLSADGLGSIQIRRPAIEVEGFVVEAWIDPVASGSQVLTGVLHRGARVCQHVLPTQLAILERLGGLWFGAFWHTVVRLQFFP